MPYSPYYHRNDDNMMSQRPHDYGMKPTWSPAGVASLTDPAPSEVLSIKDCLEQGDNDCESHSFEIIWMSDESQTPAIEQASGLEAEKLYGAAEFEYDSMIHEEQPTEWGLRAIHEEFAVGEYEEHEYRMNRTSEWASMSRGSSACFSNSSDSGIRKGKHVARAESEVYAPFLMKEDATQDAVDGIEQPFSFGNIGTAGPRPKNSKRKRTTIPTPRNITPQPVEEDNWDGSEMRRLLLETCGISLAELGGRKNDKHVQTSRVVDDAQQSRAYAEDRYSDLYAEELQPGAAAWPWVSDVSSQPAATIKGPASGGPNVSHGTQTDSTPLRSNRSSEKSRSSSTYINSPPLKDPPMVRDPSTTTSPPSITSPITIAAPDRTASPTSTQGTSAHRKPTRGPVVKRRGRSSPATTPSPPPTPSTALAPLSPSARPRQTEHPAEVSVSAGSREPTVRSHTRTAAAGAWGCFTTWHPYPAAPACCSCAGPAAAAAVPQVNSFVVGVPAFLGQAAMVPGPPALPPPMPLPSSPYHLSPYSGLAGNGPLYPGPGGVVVHGWDTPQLVATGMASCGGQRTYINHLWTGSQVVFF